MMYSRYNKQSKRFELPASFSEYRVVFSTLGFSATVVDMEDGFDHLDYIIIDEAKSLLEREINQAQEAGYELDKVIPADNEYPYTRLVMKLEPQLLACLPDIITRRQRALGEFSK